MAKRQEKLICRICNEAKPVSEIMPAAMVRSAIFELIKKQYPDITQDDYICLADLNRFRNEYIEDVLEREKGEITALEKEVLGSLQKHELLASNINEEFDKRLTSGERVADHVAEFGGSWRFIFIFAGIVLLWVLLNSAYLLFHPFDPYPYILLNLILSCLAAIQAPVIMMSQNRQEDKDRLRSKNDYQVNLKAELEIRLLNTKIDQLLSHQWQRLLEIQQIQTDLMEELISQKKPRQK